MKLIKRYKLTKYDKHKVESPFFASSEIQRALHEIRPSYSRIEGLEEFVEEYKFTLGAPRYAQADKIRSILETQNWYFITDRPANPIFPEKTSSATGGQVWGPSPLREKRASTQASSQLVEAPLVSDALTVYLGGAGMEGEYIENQKRNLISVGIKGAYAGKLTEHIFADAAAVLKYRYPVRSMTGFSATGPFKIDADWSLRAIGINRKLPKEGQFNLIGYSWGSLVAAQSALFHADLGQAIDHLVLIGSPISQAFLDELNNTPKIRRVVIIDLTSKGDRIFAGMSDAELIQSLPSLLAQMTTTQLSTSGKGHFFYGAAGREGDIRRHQLAERLKNEGLE
jgi:hypothetical protein